MTAVELTSTMLLDQGADAASGPDLGVKSIGHRYFQQQFRGLPALPIRQGGRPAGGEPHFQRLLPTAIGGIAPNAIPNSERRRASGQLH